MRDDIIKKILKDNDVEYKLTPKYFQIPWEIKMNQTKAPKWFSDWTSNFERKNDERWEKQERFNKNQMELNSRLESKVDRNTEMILKAHPEFNK